MDLPRKWEVRRTLVGEVLPRDVRTRRSMVNSVVLSESTVLITSRVLADSSFCRGRCNVVFSTVIRLYGRKGPMSLIALRGHLGRGRLPPSVDDVRCMESLVSTIPASTGIGCCTGVIDRGTILHELVGTGRRVTGAYCLRGRGARVVLRRTRGGLFGVLREHGGRRCIPVRRMILGTVGGVRGTSGLGNSMANVPANFVSLSCGASNVRPSSLILVTTHPSVKGATFMLGVTRCVTFQGSIAITVFDLRVSGRRLIGQLLTVRSRMSSRGVEANGLGSRS